MELADSGGCSDSVLQNTPRKPRKNPKAEPARELVDAYFYSIKEASLFTGRSVGSIYNDVSNGRGIPVYRVGKSLRFRGSDIRATMERCRVPMGPQE